MDVWAEAKTAGAQVQGDGPLVREGDVAELNMGDIKLTFLNTKGEPAKHGDLVISSRWKIEGTGLDSERVMRVEIPTLDKCVDEYLMVKVTMAPSILVDGRKKGD